MLVQAIKAILFIACCGLTLGMIHSLTRDEGGPNQQSSMQKIYLDPDQIAVDETGLFVELGKKIYPVQALYYDGGHFYIEKQCFYGESTAVYRI